MIKRFAVKTVALWLFLGALSTGAVAQVGSGCQHAIIWFPVVDGAISAVFPGAQCPSGPVVGEGPFSNICTLPDYSCPPVAGAAETCPACTAAQNAAASPSGGLPIALASGNTFIKETDVRLPGLSGGLTLTRIWNSVWPSTQTPYQIGMFGPNWRSTFEERVFTGADGYLKYGRSDGSFWSFGYGSPTGGYIWSVAAPANGSAQMLIGGSSNWTITFQNGETRIFDSSTGKLMSIVDRNGNTTQLSYDGSGRLVTVTDPVSRHLYFTYGSGGASYLVSQVTTDTGIGISISYSYDSLGRLSQVTEQDSSTFNFAYNSQSLITAVTDSMGKTLESHTYDTSARGLSSSQASGVNAITVSY
jgi:YD repeat-containing protein